MIEKNKAISTYEGCVAERFKASGSDYTSGKCVKQKITVQPPSEQTHGDGGQDND
ncbi:hypothetical protein CANARDRAFT_26718 [[Candida] arabinofermentans NRRL YB-2248]|uniref:Uncharacterized protein n=1 Tax=[Candida] arabinofermentans NRRL YB-2248 TaxID=983967 RepID=A0A1E4T6L0_9ASCO|nr:hypothetical protein CANARDRAFT_26718 [[Candida] arabinofermentans NRRL YB-2248]